MLESISIQGFRKYTEFSIDHFGQINFILGSNNVGKTSVLEAVFAWACGQNAMPFINIPLARGRYSNIQQPYWIMEELLATVNDRKSIPLKMSFDGIYNGKSVCFKHKIYPSELLSEYDTSYKNKSDLISIRTNGEQGQIPVGIQNIFQIQHTTIARWEIENEGSVIKTDIVLPLSQISGIKPFCQAKFIDVLSQTAVGENVQIYASLKREQLLDEVTAEIRKVFPEIYGFDMIPYPDGTQSPVSVIKKSGLLPLYACGDGIQRWFYILGAMALYKKSIVCIDEIDTGFDHAAQAEFSVNLVKNAVKNDVQLFITTHSIEFLDCFLKTVKNNASKYLDKINIITIRDIENSNKVRILSASEAYDVRDNFNLELR